MGYFKKRALRFVDVTDNLDITIELVDNSQPITNAKNEKVMKQNKRAAKKKVQLDNLFTPIQTFTIDFVTLLLSCFALVS